MRFSAIMSWNSSLSVETIWFCRLNMNRLNKFNTFIPISISMRAWHLGITINKQLNLSKKTHFQISDYKHKAPDSTILRTSPTRSNKPTLGQPKSQLRPSNSRSSLRPSQSLTFIPGHTFTAYCGELTERAKAQVRKIKIFPCVWHPKSLTVFDGNRGQCSISNSNLLHDFVSALTNIIEMKPGSTKHCSK